MVLQVPNAEAASSWSLFASRAVRDWEVWTIVFEIDPNLTERMRPLPGGVGRLLLRADGRTVVSLRRPVDRPANRGQRLAAELEQLAAQISDYAVKSGPRPPAAIDASVLPFRVRVAWLLWPLWSTDAHASAHANARPPRRQVEVDQARNPGLLASLLKAVTSMPPPLTG